MNLSIYKTEMSVRMSICLSVHYVWKRGGGGGGGAAEGDGEGGQE